METAFTFQLKDYYYLLRDEMIPYREINEFLVVGNTETSQGWVIYISCKTSETIEILKKLLKVFKKQNVNFKIIKNQLVQYALNAGAYGECEVGKVISIYPKTDDEAVVLTILLCNITNSNKGPIIPDALRMGSCLYAQYVTSDNAIHNFSNSTIYHSQKIPFDIPKQYKATKRRRSIIGKYYVPIQLLSCSPKGDIFKAITLKRFAFNWCLIKQGKPAALDDYFNREMKDRLLWQKAVIEEISDQVRTPKVLDYFEKGESSYLVMDYIEGETFGNIIFSHLNGKTWKELEPSIKDQLLNLYIQAIDILVAIHKKGYVHRDITDSNFLILADGSLCIIDFELSYNLDKKLPDPPFVLGSYGYAAPEQLQYAIPDYTEDVYSIGALFCYLISGSQPKEFISENSNVTTARLHRLTGDPRLTKLISRCLDKRRESRPDLNLIREGISTYLKTLI